MLHFSILTWILIFLDNKMTIFFSGVTSDKAKEEVKESEKMETDDTKTSKKKVDALSPEEKARQEKIEKLSLILSGHKTIYCHLQFLMRNDKTDPLILKQTKDAVR